MIFSGSINTKPVAKQRPKLTKSGRAYNPQKTRDAQRQQAFLFRLAANTSDMEFPFPKTPLCVTLRFYHKGGKPSMPKMTVPDVDNLVKLTLDAMTNANIWRDDNQITKLISEDYWAGPDGQARIEFVVEKHIIEQQSDQPTQIELFAAK